MELTFEQRSDMLQHCQELGRVRAEQEGRPERATEYGRQEWTKRTTPPPPPSLGARVAALEARAAGLEGLTRADIEFAPTYDFRAVIAALKETP